MKKRVTAFALLVLFVCPLLFSMRVHAQAQAAPKTGVTINVYNWGEYISNGVEDSLDVNKEFTRRTGIEVNYTTFESNENLYAKLVSGGANYDVVIPSDYMISKLVREGLLQKLDFQNIPNFKYIDSEFLKPVYDPTGEYSVPYTWGVVGIFYNKNYVKETVDSWDILWDEKYSGKILMFDNPRDAFGIAQKMLGFSFNSTESSEWEQAAMLLKQQKPLVQAYVMDQIFDKMASGEAWVAPYYAGDAATLVESNPDIGFAIPTKQGTNFFVDAACVPVTSKNKEAAEAYINFLCEPEIAAANVEYIGYSTPESAAKELLPEEIVNNPNYYPPKEIMNQAETFAVLPDDTNLQLDTLWAEVKMGGPGETATLIAILAVFLAVYLVVIIYKRRKRKWELQ